MRTYKQQCVHNAQKEKNDVVKEFSRRRLIVLDYKMASRRRVVVIQSVLCKDVLLVKRTVAV